MTTILNASLIRLMTALIPVKRVRVRVRRRLLDRARDARTARLVPIVRARYVAHARRCRDTLARGGRLRVAFLVCDASMFSAEPVFQAMVDDARFEPFIAVVPRVTRGEAFLRETLAKTQTTLLARYPGNVESLYDPETRTARSLEGRADLVFTSIIYDDQTLEQYNVDAVSTYALVAGMLYGYGGMTNSSLARVRDSPMVSAFWRFFAPNEAVAASFRVCNPYLSEATVVSGYPKMDRLASIVPRPRRPKTILVCPHHTLARGPGVMLALSNFLRFADFFLRLPKMFPDVKFVFRPHPLLFPRLSTREWWGTAQTARYRAEMEAMPNVEFQQGGDYFETFANSDALIHDCGSFLAEYFYTGRRQCYMAESEAALRSQYNDFGNRVLDHVSLASSEDEIVAFVRDVVASDGPLVLDAAAADFARREICLNHPHAAARVVAEVMAAIERNGG